MWTGVGLRLMRLPTVAADFRSSLALKLQFSEVLEKWRRFFGFLAAQQGKEGLAALEQRLELGQLQVRGPSAAWGTSRFSRCPQLSGH